MPGSGRRKAARTKSTGIPNSPTTRSPTIAWSTATLKRRCLAPSLIPKAGRTLTATVSPGSRTRWRRNTAKSSCWTRTTPKPRPGSARRSCARRSPKARPCLPRLKRPGARAMAPLPALTAFPSIRRSSSASPSRRTRSASTTEAPAAGAKVWVRGWGIFAGEERRRYETIVNCYVKGTGWAHFEQAFHPTRRLGPKDRQYRLGRKRRRRMRLTRTSLSCA